MAFTKLSQIASGGAILSSDEVVAVRGGNTDVLVSLLYTPNISSLGLPSQPNNVTALAGNAQANVYWTQPISGIPTSYLVTCSNAATQTVSASLATGSTTFTGLTNGTAYTFTVQAIDSRGTGLVSSVSNSVTPNSTASSILPSGVGQPIAWYSATQQPSPPSNGSPLTSWTDLSGNGFNATGSGTGSGGTWVSSWSGGNPAIALNGTNQYYTMTGLNFGNYGPEYTVYVLFDVTATPPSSTSDVFSTLSTASSTIGSYLEFHLSNAASPVPTMQVNQSTASGSALTQSVPVSAAVTMPGVFYLNGTQVGTTTYIDPFAANSPATPLSLGCANGGYASRYLTGHLAEFLIFNQVHNSTQLSNMFTYLGGLHA